MDKRFTDDCGDYTTSATVVANIRYGVGAIAFQPPKKTWQRFSGLVLVVFLLMWIVGVVAVGSIWLDSAPRESSLDTQEIDRLAQ